MDFFNNKENEILKFKLNSEGIDVNNIEPRLILTTKENKNILFIGEVDKDICRFNIPELSIYEKGDHGKIKFEIISEDLYFPVWEDKFEIKSKASVKIEEMISEIQHSSKPKISVSEARIEAKPVEIKQKPIEIKSKEEEKTTPNKTLSILESIFDKPVSIVEEEDENVKEEKSTSTPITPAPKITKFESFK